MKSLLGKIFLLLSDYFNEKSDLLKEKTNGNNTFLHTSATDPRIGLSITEYDSYFMESEIRKAAFEKAWEIRNFEIKLYWQRATYFWAFIAASFAGYIAIISSYKYPANFLFELQYYVICLGLIFSIAWCLVNWGSKKWQENWEGHIDRLEEPFTGPLYKVVRSGLNFSVSKINILVSVFIAAIWLSLAIQYLIKYSNITKCNNLDPLYIIVSSLITLSVIILFFTWGRTGSSNMKKPYHVRKIN